jgi:type II secretory pathway component PulF
MERLRGRAGALSRFSNFTSELLEADVDTRSAVRLAGLVTDSMTIRQASSQLANEWNSHRLLPGSPLGSTILYALQAELPKNGRARLLAEISACHAQRVRHTYSWTRGIVEPAAIIVVGTLVGLTVVALFLPLFSLVQGLT